MFQFTGFASDRSRIPCLQHGGLPHSEISGSKVICTFPKLIAAYHVLHRLWEPRHSPCALSNFLNLFFRCSYTSKKKLLYFLPICQWTLVRPLKADISCRKTEAFGKKMWRIRESNPWPLECKSSALANWANPPFGVSSLEVCSSKIFVNF